MNSGPIKSYRDLRVWHIAVELSVEIYEVTKRFPASEAYGLTAQMRRAAVSVAANTAEGHGRETGGNFAQFLRTSQGSLKELETHAILANRIGLPDDVSAERILARTDDVGKMFGSLIRKVTGH